MINFKEFRSKYSRVLVTGGAGFIGGAMIRRLLIDTDVFIFNLDKLSYASDLRGIEDITQNLPKNGTERYKLLKVDLIDFQSTLNAVKESNPDIIFHLAAESHVDRSIDSPLLFAQSNVLGTCNLLQASRNHWENLSKDRKENFRFQHISTDEVFGSLSDSGKFSESTPYDPRSPYSASKASSDHFVNAWHHTYGLPVISTNCSNNYGPWQFPEKLIPVVIMKALAMQDIPLYGDGSNIRDWLYVDDHVEALLLIALKGRLGAKYCIGGNNEYSNRDIVQKICLLLDRMRPREISYSSLIKSVKDRPGHDYRYAIDADLISKELKWQPSNTFESGINQTISWYLANQQWCNQVKEKSGYSGERLG